MYVEKNIVPITKRDARFVFRRAYVLLCFLGMLSYCDVQHFAVAHLFSFLCCLFCISCLRPVSSVPMLSVSLDCPFLIFTSVVSNVYLQSRSLPHDESSMTNVTLSNPLFGVTLSHFFCKYLFST